MNEALRIVVVAPDLAVTDPDDEHALLQAERSRALRIGLLENNFNLIATLPADVFLSDRLAQLQPDLIIVDAESEARDALEHVVMATRDARRPIVMFTNDEDTSHVKDAVAAGVSAYIVAGLAPQRIRPILDVAMARFQHEQALRAELADAKTELKDDTPILESGLLSSLDVVELILFIENLKGAEVDVDDIEPEVLTNVNTIYDGFFRGEAA